MRHTDWSVRSRRGQHPASRAGMLVGPRGDDPNEGGSEAAAAEVELPTDTFGDLESPCGEGDDHGRHRRGRHRRLDHDRVRRRQGFTATPGLNQEMGDAWRRHRVVQRSRRHQRPRDHRQPLRRGHLRGRRVQKESCSQDFMIVGHGFGLDRERRARADQVQDADGSRLHDLTGPPRWARCTTRACPTWSTSSARSTQQILIDESPRVRQGRDGQQRLPRPLDQACTSGTGQLRGGRRRAHFDWRRSARSPPEATTTARSSRSTKAPRASLRCSPSPRRRPRSTPSSRLRTSRVWT